MHGSRRLLLLATWPEREGWQEGRIQIAIHSDLFIDITFRPTALTCRRLLAYCLSTHKNRPLCCVETSGTNYPAKQCHIPEEPIPQSKNTSNTCQTTVLDSAVSTAAWFTKEHCFVDGSQASPVCRSGKSSIKNWIGVERLWDDTDRGKEKYWEKHCHTTTWSTTNLTRTDLGSDQGLRGEKPATNRLKQNTAVKG